MKIKEVTFWTNQLKEQLAFYRDVLEFPLLENGDKKIGFQAGSSRLEFQDAVDTWQGMYHFAFDVPPADFDLSCDWLRKRVTLLKDVNGQDYFTHQNWNARAVYFKDPSGNVLEWIARSRRPTQPPADYQPKNVLSISEVGLPSEAVQDTVHYLTEWLEEGIYEGEGSDNFCAVGSEEGLLIVVALDRIWFPDTGQAASYNPLRIVIENQAGKHFEMNAPSYPIRVIEEGSNYK